MNFDSHLKRAELLLDQSRYKLAEQEARGALAFAPDDASAHAILAQCLGGQNQFGKAEQAARRAIHLAPDEPSGYAVLSCVWMYCSRYEEALQAIQEAIRLDPHWVDYRYLQAFLFRALGKYRAALEAADEGLALDAKHVECMNIRAEVLMELGRPREARQMLRTALKLEPENATTHDLLGDYCLSANDSKQALKHYREALRISPECSQAQGRFKESRSSLYGRLVRFHLEMSRRRGMFELVFAAVPMSLYCLIRLYCWLAVPERATFWIMLGVVLTVLACMAVLAWYCIFSRPMIDLLFRLNRRIRLITGVSVTPFGEQKFQWPPARHARAFLSPERIASSNAFGVCLLLAFLGVEITVGTISKVESNGDRGIGVVSQMLLLPPYVAFILVSAGFRPRLLFALLGVLGGAILLEQIAWQTQHLTAQRVCEGMFHLLVLASIWCVRFSPLAPPNEGEESALQRAIEE